MKLPGIGEKTATRLAFYTMDMPQEVWTMLKHYSSEEKISINVQFCGILPKKDICDICLPYVIKQRLWWLSSLKM